MIYYLYKITNNLNGKIYIGVHQTQDINDEYFGSGSLLKRAISKYGRENFTKEILEFFENESDMLAREKTVVNSTFVADINTYNINEGGHGSFSYINSLPRQGHKPNQHKEASVKANLAFKHRMQTDLEFKQKFCEKISATLKEKHRTGKIKHQNPAKYHRWVSHDTLQTTKYVNLNVLDSYLKDGWYLGKRYNNHSNLGKKYKKRPKV